MDLSKVLLGKEGKKLAVHPTGKIIQTSPHSKIHFDEVRLAIMTQGHAVIKKPIQNTDRAVGTRLSGEIMFLHGSGGFKGNIKYRVYGAGMTGGVTYIYYSSKQNLENINKEYVKLEQLNQSDINLLWRMIRSHKFHTGLPLADNILKEWNNGIRDSFVKVIPLSMESLNLKSMYESQILRRSR